MTREKQDELKLKARAAIDQLHRLMQAGDYESTYQMIDDEAPLKYPKEEAVGYLKRLVRQ